MNAEDPVTDERAPEAADDVTVPPVELDAVDVARILHTLRNPLTAILIGSQHLAGLDLGKLPTATAACIAHSAKQLAQIVDQLEQLARLRVKGRP